MTNEHILTAKKSNHFSCGVLCGLLATLLFNLALSGCAISGPAPLSTIDKVPIVEVGGRLPESGDYVLHYPKGYILPVVLSVDGGLFAGERTSISTTLLGRDLYLYKHWASHDGKTWKNSHDLIDVRITGGFDTEGLKVDVELGAK